MANNVKMGVVLQGGGALGAYELGALKALFEWQPTLEPSVVTGISIGAVNAAILVGAKDRLDENGKPMPHFLGAIKTLEEVWINKLSLLNQLPEPIRTASETLIPPMVQQNLSMFGNPGMYTIRPEYLFNPLLAPFLTTSMCDTTPLRRTLEEYVDPNKLNQPNRVRLAVTSINIKTGESAVFDNGKQQITFDHILASGSLPPGFPMTHIDGEYYWDGGLFSNTPLSPAINALEEQEADQREIMIVELIPRLGEVPQNIKDVLDRSMMMQFASKIKLDSNMFNKWNDIVDKLNTLSTLAAGLPDSPEKTQMQGLIAGFLADHKDIGPVWVVSPGVENPIPGAGGADFSAETVKLRIQRGYEDAKVCFAQQQQELQQTPDLMARAAPSATAKRTTLFASSRSPR